MGEVEGSSACSQDVLSMESSDADDADVISVKSEDAVYVYADETHKTVLKKASTSGAEKQQLPKEFGLPTKVSDKHLDTIHQLYNQVLTKSGGLEKGSLQGHTLVEMAIEIERVQSELAQAKLTLDEERRRRWEEAERYRGEVAVTKDLKEKVETLSDRVCELEQETIVCKSMYKSCLRKNESLDKKIRQLKGISEDAPAPPVHEDDLDGDGFMQQFHTSSQEARLRTRNWVMTDARNIEKVVHSFDPDPEMLDESPRPSSPDSCSSVRADFFDDDFWTPWAPPHQDDEECESPSPDGDRSKWGNGEGDVKHNRHITEEEAHKTNVLNAKALIHENPADKVARVPWSIASPSGAGHQSGTGRPAVHSEAVSTLFKKILGNPDLPSNSIATFEP